jgi:hypothetical protein
MNLCYITFRSVTFAQQGERVLESAGIRARLQRTPRWMEEQGCGYCLTVREADIRRAVQTLGKNRVPLRRVYGREDDGELKELML